MATVAERIANCVERYSGPEHWITKNHSHLLVDGQGKVEKPDPALSGSKKPEWFQGGKKPDVAAPGNLPANMRSAISQPESAKTETKPPLSSPVAPTKAKPDIKKISELTPEEMDRVEKSFRKQISQIGVVPDTPEQKELQSRLMNAVSKIRGQRNKPPTSPTPIQEKPRLTAQLPASTYHSGGVASQKNKVGAVHIGQEATESGSPLTPAERDNLRTNFHQIASDMGYHPDEDSLYKMAPFGTTERFRQFAASKGTTLANYGNPSAKPETSKKTSEKKTAEKPPTGHTPGIQNIVETRKTLKSGKDTAGNWISPEKTQELRQHLIQSIFAAKGLNLGPNAGIVNLDRKINQGVGYYSKLMEAYKKRPLPNQMSLFGDDSPEEPHGPSTSEQHVTMVTTRTKHKPEKIEDAPKVVVTKKTLIKTKKHKIQSGSGKANAGIHWITIHGGEHGRGTHIQVKSDGTIVNPPSFLKEKGITSLSDFGKVKRAAEEAKAEEPIESIHDKIRKEPSEKSDTKELLEADSEQDQGTVKQRMDRIIEEEFSGKPTRESEGTGGGSGGLSQGDGELSPGATGVDAGLGDGQIDRERTGDAGSIAGTDRFRGSDDKLGGGRSGSGHDRGDGKAIAESLSKPATKENPTDLAAGNWRYQTRDFFEGGLQKKFQNNLNAARTLREISEEGRTTATPEEQEAMSKFVGWGQFPGLFNEYWNHDLEAVMSREEYYENKDKWEEQRKLIKPLMTDDEWDSARKATLNSHFTSPDVIDAHWKMAQKLGFNGGRYLEPSAGVGYYLGQMPADLASRTRISAVELDQSTGGMLQKLYPAAHVEVQGFEKHQVPKNFYDLVASNVPFGGYKVHDPEYNKYQANIHDYFFLKSADLTKPGGLVMHVTSTGTMDKKDDKIRKELAKTCDFVAAVRFPGGTHQANAGTQVVTDMIILRKRYPNEALVTLDHTPPEADPNEPGFTGMTTDSLGRVYHWVDGKRVSAPDWMSIKEVPDPAGGEPIPVSAYFADHPEQILGTLDRTGSMYKGDSVNVSATDDFEQRMQDAIDRLPEGVSTSLINPRQEQQKELFSATTGVKDGGYVIHDGKLFKRDGGEEIPQNVKTDTLARIDGQLQIRDAKQQVIDAEYADQDASEARTELNRVYDQFVAKYGPLSNKENRKAMEGDPDAPNLLALEKYNPTDKTASKSDMFSKETIRPRKSTEHADNVGEAVGISLNETGGIDPEHIAKLTGKEREDVEAELLENGLAFDDPQEGWKAADQYLSGNVRRKLTMARAAAAADPKYKTNVEALEKVQPEDIDYQDIDVKLGANWIPASDVQQFAEHLVDMRPNSFRVEYVPETNDWQFSWRKDRWNLHNSAAIKQYETEDLSFETIMDRLLSGKSMAVYDVDQDGSRTLNEEKTKAAQEKANEIKEKFGEWVWSDEDRRDRLHRYYNDNFNNIRPIKYDGSHLTFPGMNPDMEMRDVAKNFVWQVISTGRGLAAHEVGMGKTRTMVASAMELRRLGLAKKPCIAVLKANIEQITKEALETYPGAKILSTVDMFDAKKRKKAIAQIATGDYDMIIMTHDHLNLLGMRPETEQAFINGELQNLRAAKAAAWQEDKSKNNRIVKSLESAEAKLEARLKNSIKSEEKDDAIHFEDSGIDTIIVDEAHKYKSLPVFTKGERVKGVPQGNSNRAINMLMRSQWLMQKNGNRGVVFATGTPVANTMAELYNIQRYLQPDELKQRGIDSFDAWASAFGDRQTQVEATVTGDFAPVTRFSKFVNIPELMNIAGQVMDVQRIDDLKNKDGSAVVVRPKRQDKIVLTKNNEQIKNMMDDLRERAIACKGKRPEKGADNMAVVCSDGRKGSVDMRMLYATAADDPNSKLNQCVDNVLKLSKDRPGTTQLIFSNVGVNPSPQTGFHLYGDLIDKLVAGGIPREKIADFSKLEGAKKDAAQEAMRRGDIVVGIGSTEKLGTGVNVQNRVAALHHLDVPWQPAEIEQRDGRGYRNGNRNDPTKPLTEQKVDIYKYVAEGSLDTFMWQVVGNKAFFINQVVNGKDKSTRSVSDEDTETLTPEQFMAVASGDPRILKKVQLESDVKDLKRGHLRHQREQSKLAESLKKHQDLLIPDAEKQAKRHAEDTEHVARLAREKDDKKKEKGGFSLQLNGKMYAGKKEAEEAFAQYQENYYNRPYSHRSNTSDPIGEHKGFKIFPAPYVSDTVNIQGPSGERYPARASIGSIEAVIRGIPNVHKASQDRVEQLKKDVETMKSNIGKEYRRVGELSNKSQELRALEKELQKKKDVIAADSKPGTEKEAYSRVRCPSVEERFKQAYSRKCFEFDCQSAFYYAVERYAKIKPASGQKSLSECQSPQNQSRRTIWTGSNRKAVLIWSRRG